MICLADKVYLTYAESSIGPDNAENVADQYVQIIDRGLVDIQNHFFQKNRIHYSKNITQLLSEQSFSEFFDSLISKNEKVYIYADEKSFCEFFIKWFKGIFPKANCETLYHIFQSYSDYQRLLPNRRKVYLDIDNDSRHIPVQEILPLYWKKSLEEFRGLFELYSSFEIPMPIKLRVSNEVQLIQYILNKESYLTSNMALAFARLYKIAFMKEFLGLKRTCIRKLYTLAKTDHSLSFKFTSSSSIYEQLSQNKKLNFLLDNSFDQEDEKSFDSFMKLEQHINQLNTLIEIDMLISDKTDNPCISGYLENGKHPKPLELIAVEIEQISPYEILKSSVQDNELNIFLVQSILSLKNAGNNDSLLNQLNMEFEI
ncbi:hypothetical protein [Halobacteriovorax sp. HLS]|uniref:hypothetical protein n=1 Tax=Halobacteriovorax sp. HLS TaxID=2234000 RepID=UPI000FDCCBEF|nr:hypothetical protein [Halobacteriovorax sp. HLS]